MPAHSQPLIARDQTDILPPSPYYIRQGALQSWGGLYVEYQSILRGGAYICDGSGEVSCGVNINGTRGGRCGGAWLDFDNRDQQVMTIGNASAVLNDCKNGKYDATAMWKSNTGCWRFTDAKSLVDIWANCAGAWTLYNPPKTPPAPASASFMRIWSDIADQRLHDMNAAGVVGTTVIPRAAVPQHFVIGIAPTGNVSLAQPSFADLTGTISSNLFLSTSTYAGPIGPGRTLYAGVGCVSEVEADCAMPASKPMLLSGLRAFTAAAPGEGATVVTLRRNGIDQMATCTLSAAGQCSSGADPVAYATADFLSIKIKTGEGAAPTASFSFALTQAVWAN